MQTLSSALLLQTITAHKARYVLRAFQKTSRYLTIFIDYRHSVRPSKYAEQYLKYIVKIQNGKIRSG